MGLTLAGRMINCCKGENILSEEIFRGVGDPPWSTRLGWKEDSSGKVWGRLGLTEARVE